MRSGGSPPALASPSPVRARAWGNDRKLLPELDAEVTGGARQGSLRETGSPGPSGQEGSVRLIGFAALAGLLSMLLPCVLLLIPILLAAPPTSTGLARWRCRGARALLHRHRPLRRDGRLHDRTRLRRVLQGRRRAVRCALADAAASGQDAGRNGTDQPLDRAAVQRRPGRRLARPDRHRAVVRGYLVVLRRTDARRRFGDGGAWLACCRTRRSSAGTAGCSPPGPAADRPPEPCFSSQVVSTSAPRPGWSRHCRHGSPG